LPAVSLSNPSNGQAGSGRGSLLVPWCGRVLPARKMPAIFPPSNHSGGDKRRPTTKLAPLGCGFCRRDACATPALCQRLRRPAVPAPVRFFRASGRNLRPSCEP
jgi:hypothetical protein